LPKVRWIKRNHYLDSLYCYYMLIFEVLKK